MAVIISTTDEDEARDLAAILGAGFGWPYRIFVADREFRLVPAEADPRHLQVRDLLARSPRGFTARQLWLRLAGAGQAVTRQTLHDWLARDEQAGLIARSGNCWARRQPAGDVPVDRDIPGARS